MGKVESQRVVLVFASTPAERRLVEDWIANGIGSTGSDDVIDGRDPGLGAQLAGRSDEQPVIPVRVVWLPPERGGQRRASVVDVITFANPRRPSARAQERILRDDAHRSRVLAGAPASLGELRARFEKVTGRPSSDAEGFGAFVARQGVLALEREQRSLTGDRYKVPRLVAEDIRQTARFSTVVRDLARATGAPEAETEAKAAAALDEMVASQGRFAVDVWDQFGRWMSRAYTLDVDDDSLGRVRELGREHALVFLPSHRSYLDPMVLRHALSRNGFAPNHILGGINVAVWPIGPVARRSGLVFIRRSFRDAPIYKAVLREYIGYLLRKRFNLEWYIEGGRSRTGKLRPPRYGLLAYVIDAYKASAGREVYLVPASIIYDQLHEVGKMAAEDLGAVKKPESFRWLVDLARAQSRGFGRAHVTFGEPLALGPALAEDDSVTKVAFEVCHRINKATPATPMSIVALAILGAEGRGITFEEGRVATRPILEYMQRRGLPTTSDVEIGDLDPFRSALSALVHAGVVTEYPGGGEPVYAIDADKHLEAAFYRNASIHFFLTRAIVELALLRAVEHDADDLAEEVWQEALRLRDLLKFEFFFARKREFAEEVREEAALMDPEWERRTISPEQARETLAEQPLHLAPRVLRPFVEAYQVVADQLALWDPALPLEKKAFVEECLAVGRQRRVRGLIVSAESVSAELFGGGLRVAANRGLLDVDDSPEALRDQRRAFALEVSDVNRRVQEIAVIGGRTIPAQERSWVTSSV
jgi:glycerol-3-phosphate O-acyltransferase